MTADWVRGRILFVADVAALGGRLVPVVQACLQAGVRMVQLRGKGQPDKQLYSLGLALRELAAEAGALLFVNDRVDIALALGADGVHLGQQDLPLAVARRLLQGKILGLTCRTPQQAQQAEAQGADYVSLGAVFPSPTKPSAPVMGLELIQQARPKIHIPICAIGGIGSDNLRGVLAAGADFVAVISAVSQAADPKEAAALLVSISAA